VSGNFPTERAGALELMTELCEDDLLSGSVMGAMSSCGFEPLNRMMECEHVETSIAGSALFASICEREDGMGGGGGGGIKSLDLSQ